VAAAGAAASFEGVLADETAREAGNEAALDGALGSEGNFDRAGVFQPRWLTGDLPILLDCPWAKSARPQQRNSVERVAGKQRIFRKWLCTAFSRSRVVTDKM